MSEPLLTPPDWYFEDDTPHEYEYAIDEINANKNITFYQAVRLVNEYGEDYFIQSFNEKRNKLLEKISQGQNQAKYVKAFKCYGILWSIKNLYKDVNINEFMDWIITNDFDRIEIKDKVME